VENRGEVNLLIDTNIALEIILDQEKALDARKLLTTEEHQFFISDFSLHSVGLLLFYRKQKNGFKIFLNDIVSRIGVRIKSLFIEDMESVIDASEDFKLDFDDAYQYVLAEKYNMTIVSFDADFDRTKRGRKTPSEILKGN
jgi:predicted nucleic acid-binding protein